MDKDLAFTDVISFDALYESMARCKRNVAWKDSVAHFYLNGIEQVLKMEKKLKDGTYKSGHPRVFTITSPKTREILSIPFKDRVYQQSLNDNVLYPMMTRSLIYDNAACQTGKGTDFARARLICFLQKFYRKHGRAGYILQCDVHGYYPNMRHDVVEQMFREKLDPDIYAKVETILHDQYPGDVGYNPGSQMIQIAGISVLDKLDHYIKEQLHIKYYVRYMDDFLLVHDDKTYLEYCKDEIERKLSEIGFEFNPTKTQILPISEGVLFLGFRFVLTETGKVLLFINPQNVKRERKKPRRLVRLAKNGTIEKDKVDECYASWRNHASRGSSKTLLRNMDAYYASLWRADDGV